jgi:hypothetical protein
MEGEEKEGREIERVWGRREGKTIDRREVQ